MWIFCVFYINCIYIIFENIFLYSINYLIIDLEFKCYHLVVDLNSMLQRMYVQSRFVMVHWLINIHYCLFVYSLYFTYLLYEQSSSFSLIGHTFGGNIPLSLDLTKILMCQQLCIDSIFISYSNTLVNILILI